MLMIRTLLITATVLFAGNLAAAPVKGNVANGKKVFEANKDAKGQPVQACTSCHGVANTSKLPDGSAAPTENPIIAGQYSDYISKALHDYKNKKRANLGMQGNAGRLSEKEIADVATYLGSLKSNVHDLSTHAK
jgi:cytochrome c553